MRELLTPDRVANTIRMQRSTFVGSFLLVEGSTDRIFYERFTDRKKCQVLAANNKSNAIGVIDILEKDCFAGVLAIVDADFDRCSKPQIDRSSNIILTDTHDLETLIIQSPALEKVLTEFGSEDKIKTLDRDMRTALLEASLSIGYLRWISQLERLNLKFEGIDFKKFINEKKLAIDEVELIKTVQNKSQNFVIKCEDIQKQIKKMKISNIDPWQICCGHDLVQVLSLALQKAIGTNNTNDVKQEVLERSLRLAYEGAYFIKTQIYASAIEWESRHPECKVWRIDL
jgi:hypothetical protein